MATEIITEVIKYVCQYLLHKYDKDSREKIITEINKIANINCNDYLFDSNRSLGYSDLQNILANLNEKEIIRKERGVYYTPSDLVKFIVINSIKSAYGKLKPNNLHVMDLNGVPYKSFCTGKRIFDPTCGAGEFLLAALEIKFDLMDSHRESVGKTTIQTMVSTIYGNDINPDSITITKIRILLCVLKRYGISKIKGIADVINPNFTTIDFITTQNNEDTYDIIVGNPPYVEDTKSDLEPSIKYGNIYGNVLDNSANILSDKGCIGFVIPLSYVSTLRMKTLRQTLSQLVKEQYILSFSDRPDCLFTSVHQKLCVLFGKKRNIADSVVYTGNYKYWYNAERNNLFENLQSIKNNYVVEEYIPKLGTTYDVSIYKKIIGFKKSISDLFNGEGNEIYLNMRAAFWVKAFMEEHTGAEYKVFNCNSDNDKYLAHCLLNSSLFWWYWICVSDCWHITQKELNSFSIPSINDYNQVRILAENLEQKLEITKLYVGTKQTEYEYKHKNCTDEIHAIDDYINNLYGLTEQESLYIKDFAYRYRVGGGVENEGN